jgi:SAM-dependent methyltransferase
VTDFVYQDFEEYRRAQVETFKTSEADISQWTEGQKRFVKGWLAEYPRDFRILDAACGDGVGMQTLSSLGFGQVVGVDFSPSKAERAAATGLPVHQADIHDLRILPDASFDVVYSSHTLEHALDPARVLREFRRVLREDGHLVLVLPYPDVGEREKHCAKHILGSHLDDDATALTAYLGYFGFEVLQKAYDNFREVEVWLRLRRKRVRFSIIIPTCGRDTLRRTLESVAANGFVAGDEVLVVGDGPQPGAKAIAESFRDRIHTVYMETVPKHFWGHPQRNHAMRAAKGTHIVTIDDDDEYLDGALTAMRAAASRHPDLIPVFRMNRKDTDQIVWNEKKVFSGNLGTPLFVVPNIPERLGQWGGRYEGDFDFIHSTLQKWPEGEGAMVWKDRVTVRVN